MITMTKEQALKNYKLAKTRFLEVPTEENWKHFCNAKTICMRLGVRI